MKLNDTAMDAYFYGLAKEIVDQPPQWIIETVLEQEIVSFSTSKGTVSFDINDIEWEA